MQRAYRYRFYPTPEQESLLRRTVGCCRFVYNRALALRQEAWAQRQKKLTGYDLIKKITEWKKDPETEWLKEVSNVPLQQAVNDLEVAYQNFFAKRAKYPSFKRKSSGGSCRFTEYGFRIKNGEVWLAKTKAPLDIRWSRPLPEGATPKQCTVRLTPSGKWFISFLCNVEIEKLPPVAKSVGLDMGLTALVTTSDGEKLTNPKTVKKYRRKLASAQRHLARKQKGSKRWLRAKRKVARIYEKISETRKDQLHKLTTRLVRENQTIVVEDLSVRNMVRCHRLAGSISDASWSMLRGLLEYKCNWYGRELRVVDRWFPSSKTCHGCGHVVEKLPLNVREWGCPKCGTRHDRDVNAAINILSAGTVDYTDGGNVKPKRTGSVNVVPCEVGIPGL
jgi:transposase, IS605 OrfB family, central region